MKMWNHSQSWNPTTLGRTLVSNRGFGGEAKFDSVKREAKCVLAGQTLVPVTHLHISWKRMVRTRGLEPPTLSGPDPKSGASAIPPRAQRGQNALLTRFPQSGCCHFAGQTASSVRFTSAGFPRQVPRAQPVRLLRLLERRKRRSFPDRTLPTQPKERSIDSSKT